MANILQIQRNRGDATCSGSLLKLETEQE